jgi:hypothetical protein
MALQVQCVIKTYICRFYFSFLQSIILLSTVELHLIINIVIIILVCKKTFSAPDDLICTSNNFVVVKEALV